MCAAGRVSQELEPAKRDLREALPPGSMVRVCPHAWSLEIAENLESFTNFRVILVQGP